MSPQSEYFEALLAYHQQNGTGKYEIILQKDGVSRSAEAEIDRLIADGFLLDVGRLPTFTYVECGEFSLPLGDGNVTLRKPETILENGNFRMWITIDDRCNITRVIGLSLEKTQL